MDYSYTGGGSFAAVDVSGVRLASVPYKISVVLDLPRDEYNQRLGNFMVRMTVVNSSLDDFLLENPFPEYEGTKVVNPANPIAGCGPTLQGRLREDGRGGSVYHPLGGPSQKWPLTHNKKYIFDRLPGLVSSTKPAILPYKSWLVEVLETFVFSPLYVVGLWQQKTMVPIAMMDWPISATKSSKSVVVELDRTVNINSASLLWTVQWKGLRYFMYYHWILMFIIGTGFFWFIETLVMLLVAWYIFHAYKGYDEEDVESVENREEEFDEVQERDITDINQITEPSDILQYIDEIMPDDESLLESGRQTPIASATASATIENEDKIDILLRNRAIKQKESESSEEGYSSAISRPQLDLLDSLGPDPVETPLPLTPASTPGPWDEQSDEDIVEQDPRPELALNLDFTSPNDSDR